MYQRKDSFYTRAKRAGFRSRAAYKLEELARRYRFFGPGGRVVDLGAWPGGWLQVAGREVGATGLVVGVDLQPIDPLPGVENVVLIRGDAADPSTLTKILDLCGGPVDVLLSDLAPKLSGIRDRDVANAQALAECAVQVATRLLKNGGTLVIKLFMSDEIASFLARLRTLFEHVRTSRPEATRKGSAEIYAIAAGFKPLREP